MRYPVLRRIATLQMGEALCETGPGVDFKKQLGDLDVGEGCRDLLDQVLRRVRHRGVERRDLQAQVGENRIRNVVRGHELVHSVQFFMKRRQPTSQILLTLRIDSER
jgi:hypothetical protein